MLVTESEAEPYRLFTEGFLKELAPVGVHETALAHSVMNNRWRVQQISAMESAIYALGFRQHAAQLANETPDMAAAMSRLLTFDEKRKDLDRLRRYESSLTRQINKDIQLLTQLQLTRKAEQAKQEKEAIAMLTHFTTTGKPWNPADFGFVLSIEEIRQLEERQFLRNRVCQAS